MRDTLTTAGELVGIILIVVAGFWVYLPLGLALLGIALVLVCYQLGGEQ